MDEVAIYIWFEGVFGTLCCCCLGARGDAVDPEDMLGALPVTACDATRETASGLGCAEGGGKGDIDIAVIEAEWA